MPCTNHPMQTADLQQCWICARDFCAECVVEFQGRTMCASCKTEAVARLEMGAEAAPGEGEKAPWERRAELGAVAAWMQTVKAVMTDPGRFFERLDKTITTHECLAVPVINNVLVSISGWLVQLALMSFVTATAPEKNPFLMMFTGGFGVVMVVLSPVIAIISVYLTAGWTHLFLVITKNVKAPFHQTMRGMCYAASPNIIGVVPFLGPIVGGLWALVCEIIMVMRTHKVSGGMAFLAVLAIPLLLGCCLGIVFLGVAMMAAGAAHR